MFTISIVNVALFIYMFQSMTNIHFNNDMISPTSVVKSSITRTLKTTGGYLWPQFISCLTGKEKIQKFLKQKISSTENRTSAI